MHSNQELANAIRGIIASEYTEKVVKRAEDEIQSLVKSEKFNDFVKALIWNEMRNCLMRMELISLFPKEKIDRAVRTAIKELVNGENYGVENET